MKISISPETIEKAFKAGNGITIEIGASLTVNEPLFVDEPIYSYSYSEEEPPQYELPVLESICVDASTTPSNPGFTRYRGMYTKTKEILFSEEIHTSTNNIGEWLAIVTAMEYIKNNNFPVGIIYSDSQTAISWARSKKCRTTFSNAESDRLIAQAENFLKLKWEKPQILKWDKKVLGEIYADYGEKPMFYDKFIKI
jgi:ribonuclease HI